MNDLRIPVFRDETVTLSRAAADLLVLLCELEEKQLIHPGGTARVHGGYDEGSLETETPAVLTHRGREAVVSLREGRGQE